MGATDELIRAYAHFTLTPDKAGDADLNAQGAVVRRRKAKGPQCYGKETRSSRGSSQAVCGALRAGKIIAAGEGSTDFEAAYSRVYYSDYAKTDDKRALLLHLLSKAYRVSRDVKMLARGHMVLSQYAGGEQVANDDCIKHRELFYLVSSEIARLHHGCAMRVGKALAAMRDDSCNLT